MNYDAKFWENEYEKKSDEMNVREAINKVFIASLLVIIVVTNALWYISNF